MPSTGKGWEFFKIFLGSLFPLSLISQSNPRPLSPHWEWSPHPPSWVINLDADHQFFPGLMSWLSFSFRPRYYNPYRFLKTDVTPCVSIPGGKLLRFSPELVFIDRCALHAAASNLSLHLSTALALILSINLERSCGITSVNPISYRCGLYPHGRYMFRSLQHILSWESKTVHKKSYLCCPVFPYSLTVLIFW